MSQNGQLPFKNLAVNAARFLKCVSTYVYSTLGISQNLDLFGFYFEKKYSKQKSQTKFEEEVTDEIWWQIVLTLFSQASKSLNHVANIPGNPKVGTPFFKLIKFRFLVNFEPFVKLRETLVKNQSRYLGVRNSLCNFRF